MQPRPFRSREQNRNCSRIGPGEFTRGRPCPVKRTAEPTPSRAARTRGAGAACGRGSLSGGVVRAFGPMRAGRPRSQERRDPLDQAQIPSSVCSRGLSDPGSKTETAAASGQANSHAVGHARSNASQSPPPRAPRGQLALERRAGGSLSGAWFGPLARCGRDARDPRKGATPPVKRRYRAPVCSRGPSDPGSRAETAAASGQANSHAVGHARSNAPRSPPGIAGVPPAPAGGRQWTTRRRPGQQRQPPHARSNASRSPRLLRRAVNWHWSGVRGGVA